MRPPLLTTAPTILTAEPEPNLHPAILARIETWSRAFDSWGWTSAPPRHPPRLPQILGPLFRLLRQASLGRGQGRRRLHLATPYAPPGSLPRATVHQRLAAVSSFYTYLQRVYTHLVAGPSNPCMPTTRSRRSHARTAPPTTKPAT